MLISKDQIWVIGMSIIDSFKLNSKPKITPEDIYKKSSLKLDACIILFAYQFIDMLLEKDIIELIEPVVIHSVACDYPIYKIKGENIGVVKTTVGAPVTAVFLEEVGFIYNCDNFILFGNCGILDKKIEKHHIIVPTSAYRNEGLSYHYLEPFDYIEIKGYKVVEKVLKRLNLDYVLGKTWTTDAFYRETEEEIELRKSEGCICVEMEIASCEAVARYSNKNLYPLLYTGDRLDGDKWVKPDLKKFDEELRMYRFNIAHELAKEVIDDEY